MFCPNCGTQIPDNSRWCPNCGQGPMKTSINRDDTSPNPEPNKPQICPETHLVKAILLTMFCCWPFGIPAIVNAAAVEKAFWSGNYALAAQKSENANKWLSTAIQI